MDRFISNYYYFLGHTCWHITEIDWLMDGESFIKGKMWTFFFDKYQYYIGVKCNDNYELYEWQKKYYG